MDGQFKLKISFGNLPAEDDSEVFLIEVLNRYLFITLFFICPSIISLNVNGDCFNILIYLPMPVIDFIRPHLLIPYGATGVRPEVSNIQISHLMYATHTLVSCFESICRELLNETTQCVVCKLKTYKQCIQS